MSDAFGVEDDGSGRAALDIAGQAVRAFNHRTVARFDTHRRSGWNHVPDAYRVLGELKYLTSSLRQVIEHMNGALQHSLDDGHVGADIGSDYEGKPEEAIAKARAALTHAEANAESMYSAFETAQGLISRIHYTGPDLGDD